MPVSVMTTTEVKEMITRLRNVQCKVTKDWEAGTVQVRDRGTVVYWALQKGRGGLWICRYTDGPRVNWSNPCLTDTREEECKEVVEKEPTKRKPPNQKWAFHPKPKEVCNTNGEDALDIPDEYLLDGGD